MSYKELVTDFLCSDYYKDKSVFKKFIHPDIQIDWNSSDGFYKLNFDEFFEMSQNMGKSFTKLTADFSHIFAEDQKVCVRFSYHVETLVHPDCLPLAHFISIWECKDDKLLRAYLMSHAAEDSVENIFSYIDN